MANLEVFKTKKKNIAQLVCNRRTINCFIGKNGIRKKTREGDMVTPCGIFTFSEIYYRPDKIRNLRTHLPLKKIYKNSYWCVDSRSKSYNSYQIKKKHYLCEELYRKDELYDILITLDYNFNPTKKYKGSAIFVHCTDNHKQFTEGCLALKKKDILLILKFIRPQSKLIIY